MQLTKQVKESPSQRGGSISNYEHLMNWPIFYPRNFDKVVNCRISGIEILSSSNAKNDWAHNFLKHQNYGTDKARQEAYQGAS